MGYFLSPFGLCEQDEAQERVPFLMPRVIIVGGISGPRLYAVGYFLSPFGLCEQDEAQEREPF